MSKQKTTDAGAPARMDYVLHCRACAVPLDRRTMEFDADCHLVCPECYLRSATDEEITMALLCAAIDDDADQDSIRPVSPVTPMADPPARLSGRGWVVAVVVGVLLGCAGGCAGGFAAWLSMGTGR